MLARFRIEAGLLEAAQIQRLNDQEAREYGFRWPETTDLGGLLFPYLHPLTGCRVTARLRRDHPEVNAEGKTIAKYLSAFGDNHHLYFLPACKAFLADIAVPVVLVEAEKSVLAVAQLAERTGRRMLVIGTGGCWGWRGKIGIRDGPNGEREEVHGPLPDLSLIQWEGREVVVLFDANAATNPKVEQARRALANEVSSRGAIVRLAEVPPQPEVNGPDDLIAICGDQALIEVIDKARQHKQEPIEDLISSLSPESSKEARNEVLAVIGKERDPAERERLLKKLSKKVAISLPPLRDSLKSISSSRNSEPQPITLTQTEREEALVLLRRPDLVKQFIADLEELGCVGQVAQTTVLKLATTSGRLSENPSSITLKAESAAGKNYLLHSVLETEPPEDVIEMTRMTGKALQYYPRSLKNKLVSIAEVPGAEDAEYSIRTFQSERQIKIWFVDKDKSGQLETREHVVEGPAAFFQTTTRPHLHPENETRCFDIFVDESEEQTERIRQVQSRQYMDPMPAEKRERILRRWQNAARCLVPVPVLIPFADRIPFPVKPLRVRRDWPRVLGLIEGSGLLHQFQREMIERGGRRFLVATLDDYAIARDLALVLLDPALSGATPKCKKLVKWVETEGKEEFSKKAVDAAMDWSRKTTLKYLREAVDLGCIGLNGDEVGKANKFWFVKAVSSPLLTMPEPERLLELLEESDSDSLEFQTT